VLTQEVPSTWAMHMQRAITTRGGAVGSSRSHRTILSALEAASVGSSDSCLQGQWRSPIGTHLADGRHVYTIGWDTVIALSRDPGTGALTQLEGVSGCLAVTERQACARASRMGSPQSLAMSPDGTALYVGWTDQSSSSIPRRTGLSVLRRDSATGGSSELAGETGCLDSEGLEGCTPW